MRYLTYSTTAVCLMSIAMSVTAAQQVDPVLVARAEVQESPQKTGGGRETVLGKVVTVALRDVSLEDALTELSRQSGVRITYSRSIVPLNRRVSVSGRGISLQHALNTILAGTGSAPLLTLDQQIVITRSNANTPAKQGVITGKVVSAKTKLPISGARITLDDGTVTVTTADDGTFRLSAVAGEHTLHVRGVGFVRQAKRVTASEEVTTIEIALDPTASVLDQVIVTGTVAATERKALATPITVFTATDLQERGITRIDQLFRGAVPGVVALDQGTAVYSNARLGAMVESQVYARGSSSLNGSPNPIKTYIDGVELVDPLYLGTIDINSIDRIEIVTGPQAATIYGSGAMGGVMQVFTKRGAGGSRTEATVRFQYGMLQSNQSEGRTPTHNHTLNLSGGTGAAFTYAGSLSYLYSGQWQPGQYTRSYGGSIGGTHTQGPVTVNGTAGLTAGQNGTLATNPYARQAAVEGLWMPSGIAANVSNREGSYTSQTLGLNADYRPFPFWQHHMTAGRSQNTFDLKPVAATFATDRDSLFRFQSSTSERTTASYNTTLTGRSRLLSSSLTVGINGSWGSETDYNGDAVSEQATALISPFVNRYTGNDSWGGFGTWQGGLADKFFVTLGLRGEKNPSYGEAHTIDWTPNVGATIVHEYGNLTVKLLASYGRATRPPDPTYRLQQILNDPYTEPAGQILFFAAPRLTPEYERGPQGGIELYYGNIGSLTLNRFKQKVSDLILPIVVDSFWGISYFEELYIPQYQYQNVATLRKQGWEGTASANVGPLTVRGTYTWNDSRIGDVPAGSGYNSGQSFSTVPSHVANTTVGYAGGPLSLSLSMNWIGSTLQNMSNHPARGLAPNNARLRMYLERSRARGGLYTRTGYTKGNLNVAYRMTPSLSATMNMINIGNSFGSDNSALYPALGRQTTIGLGVRIPRQ